VLLLGSVAAQTPPLLRSLHGDGVPDLIVGEPRYDVTPYDDSGAVHVYSGADYASPPSATPTATASTTSRQVRRWRRRPTAMSLGTTDYGVERQGRAARRPTAPVVLRCRHWLLATRASLKSDNRSTS